MIPEAVAVKVPMATGFEKDPLASESWAVKTLPADCVGLVNGIDMEAPAQNGVLVRVPTRGTFATQPKVAFHPAALMEELLIKRNVRSLPVEVTIPGLFAPE